jgi:hypothetical protein
MAFIKEKSCIYVGEGDILKLGFLGKDVLGDGNFVGRTFCSEGHFVRRMFFRLDVFWKGVLWKIALGETFCSEGFLWREVLTSTRKVYSTYIG